MWTQSQPSPVAGGEGGGGEGGGGGEVNVSMDLGLRKLRYGLSCFDLQF